MNSVVTVSTSSDLPKLWYFKRPALAASTLKRAIDLRRIALFGPRQTGKTSLLCEEIAPLAQSQGMLPVYIECWADRSDVILSIMYALQKALDDVRVPASGISRTATTPVRKVGFAGASLELGDNAIRAMPDSKYLQIDALLTALLRETKKPILLIFDEFQVLANAPDAEIAAAAVRSALTQAGKRVSVIFSGSSQTQLMQTFSRAKAPLYGFANPEPYPLLGREFVTHIAKKFNQACSRTLDYELSVNLLEQLGGQPEAFLTAVGYVLASPKLTITQAAKAMLEPSRQSRWTVNWLAMAEAEKATLLILFDQKPPTGKEATAWARDFTLNPKLSTTTIARALESLISQGLVEKDLLGGRGKYQIVDPVMRAWLAHNRHALKG